MATLILNHFEYFLCRLNDEPSIYFLCIGGFINFLENHKYNFNSFGFLEKDLLQVRSWSSGFLIFSFL